MRSFGCLSYFGILLCFDRLGTSISFSSYKLQIYPKHPHARNMISVSTLFRSGPKLQFLATTWRSYSSSTSLWAKNNKSRMNPSKTYRADRVLSNRGWGSRSECFDLLKQRRVFQKVHSAMQRVQGPSEKLPMEVSTKHL